MKITATVSRKVGLPGYCSVGAECTVETTLAAKVDPVEAIKAAYQIATRMVDEQLAGQVDLHTVAADEPPDCLAEEPEPDRDADPRNDRIKPRVRDRENWRDPKLERADNRRDAAQRDGRQGVDFTDRPHDGRQLLAVVRKLEAGAGRELMPELVRWGKRSDLGWRIVEWDADQASEAFDYLLTLVPTVSLNGTRRPGTLARNGR